MFDLDRSKIEEAEKAVDKESQKISGGIETVGKRIAELNSLKKDLEKENRLCEFKAGLIKKAMVLAKGIPGELLEIKSRFNDALVKCHDERISFKEHNEALALSDSLKKEFGKKCPHNFVLGFEGYGGCGGYDGRDGAYKGERICVICGFSEGSHGKMFTDEEYRVLSDSDDRLVKYNWGMFNSGKTFAFSLLNSSLQFIEEKIKEIFFDKRTLKILSDPINSLKSEDRLSIIDLVKMKKES